MPVSLVAGAVVLIVVIVGILIALAIAFGANRTAAREAARDSEAAMAANAAEDEVAGMSDAEVMEAQGKWSRSG